MGTGRLAPGPHPRAAWILGLLALASSLGWSSPTAVDDWQPVAQGVTFREFVLPGPVHVFVARMDVTSPEVTLESSIATGSLAQGTETVSEMARRYDQTLSAWGGAWGPRHHVVVAVNGSSYNLATGEPYGGLVHDGWYAQRFGELAGTSGLAWSLDREAMIGGCVSNPKSRNLVAVARTGAQMELDSVNLVRQDDGLLLFTPQYDASTPENDGDVEVVIEVDRPVGVVPLPRGVVGFVRELRQGHGHTPLLFDQVVLTADGRAAEAFTADLRAGDAVTISQEIKDLGGDCRSSPRLDWSSTYAAIGGGFEILRRGELRHSDDIGASVHDPRTAFCLNSDHVDFVVVDGRQDGYSVGMTLDQVAEFCRDELGDTFGINQDGGGSSAMWVNGRIVNRPSDGFERAVANGMLMTVIEPALRSTRFAPGYRVLVQQSGDVRLGPGFNFATRDSLRPGTLVDVWPAASSAQGIFATGMFWWRASYDGEEGWVPERSLVSSLQALSTFQIPALPVTTP